MPKSKKKSTKRKAPKRTKSPKKKTQKKTPSPAPEKPDYNMIKTQLPLYTNFIFEMGQLKRVKRSGWWLLNIKDPESVAEHSHRTTLVAYMLATMEKADTSRAVMMAAINDLHETRLNDLHKVGHKYIKFGQAEDKAFAAQMKGLPKEVSKELKALFKEFKAQKTLEAEVARDADLLECIFQAREYKEDGFKGAQDWIDNATKVLRTTSAKMWVDTIQKQDHRWWKDLKKITRI